MLVGSGTVMHFIEGLVLLESFYPRPCWCDSGYVFYAVVTCEI